MTIGDITSEVERIGSTPPEGDLPFGPGPSPTSFAALPIPKVLAGVGVPSAEVGIAPVDGEVRLLRVTERSDQPAWPIPKYFNPW